MYQFLAPMTQDQAGLHVPAQQPHKGSPVPDPRDAPQLTTAALVPDPTPVDLRPHVTHTAARTPPTQAPAALPITPAHPHSTDAHATAPSPRRPTLPLIPTLEPNAEQNQPLPIFLPLTQLIVHCLALIPNSQAATGIHLPLLIKHQAEIDHTPILLPVPPLPTVHCLALTYSQAEMDILPLLQSPLIKDQAETDTPIRLPLHPLPLIVHCLALTSYSQAEMDHNPLPWYLLSINSHSQAETDHIQPPVP